jgi:hypothetical protein
VHRTLHCALSSAPAVRAHIPFLLCAIRWFTGQLLRVVRCAHEVFFKKSFPRPRPRPRHFFLDCSLSWCSLLPSPSPAARPCCLLRRYSSTLRLDLSGELLSSPSLSLFLSRQLTPLPPPGSIQILMQIYESKDVSVPRCVHCVLLQVPSSSVRVSYS